MLYNLRVFAKSAGRPSAICTQSEKRTSADRAWYHWYSFDTQAKTKRKTPSKNKARNCAQIRPRKAYFANSASLKIPPRLRAKRFMRPKQLANAAAFPAFIWK